MRWAAALVLVWTFAGAAQAGEAPDPAREALVRSVAALNDQAYYLGLCERHRDQAEIAELNEALTQPSADPIVMELQLGMRDAFADGRAKAAAQNWNAQQCEIALQRARQAHADADAEYDRLTRK